LKNPAVAEALRSYRGKMAADVEKKAKKIKKK